MQEQPLFSRTTEMFIVFKSKAEGHKLILILWAETLAFVERKDVGSFTPRNPKKQ